MSDGTSMSKEALAVRTRLFSLEFGVAWLIDAVFTWLPGFRNQFESLVTGTAQGQPATLRWWFSFWINVTKTDPSLWAILVALAESFIALSLLLGLFRKPMYIIGAITSFIIWGVAEGLGGLTARGLPTSVPPSCTCLSSPLSGVCNSSPLRIRNGHWMQ